MERFELFVFCGTSKHYQDYHVKKSTQNPTYSISHRTGSSKDPWPNSPISRAQNTPPWSETRYRSKPKSFTPPDWERVEGGSTMHKVNHDGDNLALDCWLGQGEFHRDLIVKQSKELIWKFCSFQMEPNQMLAGLLTILASELVIQDNWPFVRCPHSEDSLLSGSLSLNWLQIPWPILTSSAMTTP